MIIQVLFILSLAFSISNALVQDFCVADLTLAEGPAGYPCKKAKTMIANDFIFSGLGSAGNTSNHMKFVLTWAFATQFPGINGLGISIARFDIAVGGVLPMHTHPYGAELLFLIEGNIIAGFISTTGKVSNKTLLPGDLIVFPPGSLHYEVNVGKSPAIGITSFSSTDPSIEIIDFALVGNDLPPELVKATTSLDDVEIKKLKGILGGIQ